MTKRGRGAVRILRVRSPLSYDVSGEGAGVAGHKSFGFAFSIWHGIQPNTAVCPPLYLHPGNGLPVARACVQALTMASNLAVVGESTPSATRALCAPVSYTHLTLPTTPYV